MRLECSNSVLEAEVSHLSQMIELLEGQVLELEKKNGQLATETVRNETLKAQLEQVQQDIATDTRIRKELIQKLDMMSRTISGEMNKLEKSLEREKANHAKTKELLLLQDHKCSELRMERHSLLTGLDAANMTIANLETKASNMRHRNIEQGDPKKQPSKDVELEKVMLENKRLKESLDNDRMTVGVLEDQLRELNFTLYQKNAELQSAKTLEAVRTDGHSQEVKELGEKVAISLSEVIGLSKKVDELAGERNSYRSQVQDMNVALRNSLEHIKRLRARATTPSPGTSASGSPLPF